MRTNFRGIKAVLMAVAAVGVFALVSAPAKADGGARWGFSVGVSSGHGYYGGGYSRGYCPPVYRAPVYVPPPVVYQPPVYYAPPVYVPAPTYCPPVYRPPVYCPPPAYYPPRHYRGGDSFYFGFGYRN